MCYTLFPIQKLVANSKAYPALKIKSLSKVHFFIIPSEHKLVFRFVSGIVRNFKFYDTEMAKRFYFSADVLYREQKIQEQVPVVLDKGPIFSKLTPRTEFVNAQDKTQCHETAALCRTNNLPW